MRLSRFIPRFSLRSLLLLSLMITSAYGLRWRWEPWEVLHFQEQKPFGWASRSELRRCFFVGGKCHVLNLQSGEEITAFESAGWLQCGGYDFSLDDQRLVLVGGSHDEGKVRCCNANNGNEYWQRQGFTTYIQYARYLRNDTQILVGNCELYLLDASSGKTLATYKGHTDAVLISAESEDGNLLISAGMDNTARIWHANTGTSISELIGHTDAICGVEFCKDSRRVVTASWDNTIRIWDLSTAANISVNTLKEHPWSASFKGDDELVVLTDNGKWTFHRRRPEWWWGVAWLPEFWLTLLFAVALLWSLLRDRRELPKKVDAAPIA